MKIVTRLTNRLLALALACAASVAPAAHAAPQPSFGIEVGNALLCLNQLNSKYFFDYLVAAFGPPYKTEGGAYWFKATNVSLWGMQATDFLINDSSSQADFIGAYFNTTPVKLTDAIKAALGIRFTPEDDTAYPVRQSQAGSKIVYNDTNAKMYCAKSKFLVPGPEQP
ncbi:hypothetical protein I5R65_06145 [Herbaspirillum sp. AP02]|uniref:hypothetical protein n=1 Tax=unclassified Herbaspirillum TaxID=2624150 RepID=UPI0015D9807B|nr:MULTISPECIES: hypothetical protein [unclassified Herbaspirillum]MBG7619037.1 hypothetical protein [Herbaspirillum sp. AP02]NZD66321.1 hypothetical protein [Herbaspirillum sp. AP21]